MSPEDWLVCADPFAMLEDLFPHYGSGSTKEQPRPLRLYFCALARLAWDHLPAPLRATVDVAERAADVPAMALSARARAVHNIARDYLHFTGDAEDLESWTRQLKNVGISAPEPDRKPRWTDVQWQQYAALVGLPLDPQVPNVKWVSRPIHRADLIRDLFEHAHARTPFDPAWRSEPAVALAEDIYRSRNFSAIPVLADMLEEAGCRERVILNHCRDPFGLHARGCWVIDHLIGNDAKTYARLVGWKGPESGGSWE